MPKYRVMSWKARKQGAIGRFGVEEGYYESDSKDSALAEFRKDYETIGYDHSITVEKL